MPMAEQAFHHCDFELLWAVLLTAAANLVSQGALLLSFCKLLLLAGYQQ